MSTDGNCANFEPATAILATLLLDDRQTYDQNTSQRVAVKKMLLSHGGIAPQIQKYFQRLETRNYRVTSVVDDTHSPPTDKRLVLVPEKGHGRDSGIEDGRQSSVSSVVEHHHFMRTVLTHKEFSVYKHALLCAQYPVLGRTSNPNSQASTPSSSHHPRSSSSKFLFSPHTSSPYSLHLDSEDEDEDDTDYPIQTETLSAVVRGAFQLTEERHLYYDKNIMEGLGWRAPAKVLVEELVSRLALLERNRHPFYQPQAFDTRNAYDFWQQQDRIRISELINKFWYFALPSPASSLCKPSYWESMHEEYTDLMHKLIRYDKSQAMSTGSLLSSASRRLLKEFGLRFGVGELYRRIAYLVYLAEKDNFESEGLYVEHVCKQLAGLRDLLMTQHARFTMVRMEFDILCETLTKLHTLCGDWLQRLLQDTHSPDRVGSLAKLLCNVLELRVNLTGKKETPVEDYMQQYIQESLKHAYHSQKLRLTTELNLNAYTSPVSAEMVNKLIISIRDEVTRCTQCYNEVFSRFNLDVGELAIVTLYDLLMVDVLMVCQLAAEQEQDLGHIDQDLLALAYRLSQLDQEWNSYILPHAQQWRQPLMEQTRLWLHHLTRDLTTMVLNSTNSDKFTTIALPMESARLLSNPSSMAPHSSQRICQSPWSAFSSFQTKEPQQQADVPVTSNSPQQMASPDEAGDAPHRQQEVEIEAEIHRQPLPSPSTNMQSQAPVLETNPSELLAQDEEQQKAMLKEELLHGRKTKLNRTSSAPDLTWIGQESSIDKSCQASSNTKLTRSDSAQTTSTDESLQVTTSADESLQVIARPSRPNVHTFTSSGDSGFGRDRYSSQEDFDQDTMLTESGDKTLAQRSLHGRRTLRDTEQKEHCDIADNVGICEQVDNEDEIGAKYEMNNNSKDTSLESKDASLENTTIDDEQCIGLDSSSGKNQSISCDLTHDVSPDVLSDLKENKQMDISNSHPEIVSTVAPVVENEICDQQESNETKHTMDYGKTKQNIDVTQTEGLQINSEIDKKQSTTDHFKSIPASEEPVSWLDRELLRTGISPINDDDIAISKIEEDITPVHESKTESVVPEICQDKVLDDKSASQITGEYLSCPDAANTSNSVECQTDEVSTDTCKLLGVKEVTPHVHSSTVNAADSPLKTIVEEGSTMPSDQETETRTELKSTSPPAFSNSLRHAASDLSSHIPSTGAFLSDQVLQSPAVRPKYYPQRHSIPGPQHHMPRIDGTAQPQQPTTSLCITPSSHSTPIQHQRFHSTTQSLEDSITASLVMSDQSEEEEHPYLAVSCSIVDVLVMVQQMVSFVSELCLILCPLPGMSQDTQDMDVPGPLGEAYSVVVCRDRARRMRGELLNSITQTMANTMGLYVQNILAIDACATPHEDATRLLSRQINEDLEERKRLTQLGRCRHDRAGTNCNLYLFKDAVFLCDRFEPITQEMCVRINNTWCLSCLVPHFQGLLPKDLLEEGSEILGDLPFDLTPHSDPEYIATVMETQIKLLAHKLNLFLAQGLEVLMSNEMPGCCMAVRLKPITECLTNHLGALKKWLYPTCYQLFTNSLWHFMIQHLIEYLHNAGQGLGIDDLVEPAEAVLQLLQLFTLQTKRLIQLHKKLFKEVCHLLHY
ncbi:uncharacterized protein [Amphiura filiformis]|uniref:uncharacterized protein n=1 Tax=Amphiura filiformis TaxID=82378 RepID=UPI003B21C546